eukprot:scaffold2584_cov231-Pinguiococcus_pyrenoidosus.AAC.4
MLALPLKACIRVLITSVGFCSEGAGDSARINHPLTKRGPKPHARQPDVRPTYHHHDRDAARRASSQNPLVERDLLLGRATAGEEVPDGPVDHEGHGRVGHLPQQRRLQPFPQSHGPLFPRDRL